MPAGARTWIAALRGSQERLAALVGTLSPEQLRAQSYDADWIVAQVLSHIGSQAEIAEKGLTAVLDGTEPPSDFQKIWAVWDARDPDDQAAQCLICDAAHVDHLERLTDGQLDGIQVTMFGREFDAVGLVWLRLGEHAVHSWDVAVTFDPAATVAPGSVALLVDRLAFVSQLAGKPAGERFRVVIQTTGPEREFLLDVADSVSLTEGPSGEQAQARIQMPAEAMLRLMYGRLDPDHTPPVNVLSGPGLSSTVGLDQLRRVFPGF